MRSKISLFAVFVLFAAAFLTGAAVASAQERSLRFEKTVDYQLGKLMELGAVVGPVKVGKVEFSQPKTSSPAASIVGRIRGGGGSSETQATIRASFDAENPEEDEWVVTFTMDLLDSRGKLIDRITRSQGLEGEAKVVEIDHAILEYVLPFIDQVKIRMEARYD